MSVTHPYQGHYMEGAFVGFVLFASKHLMEQFEAESGPLRLGKSRLDQMIDKATGSQEAEVQRFFDWCVVQFGTPDQIEA